MKTHLDEFIQRELFPLDEEVNLESADENTEKNIGQSLLAIISEEFSVSDEEAENIVYNYLFLLRLAKKDLLDIDEQLASLKKLEDTTPSSDDYFHKKIRYFYKLNQQAREDVILFIKDKIIDFVADSKNGKYSESKGDELSKLYLSSRYDYAFFSHYYDINYDYSNEAKIRFLPGVNLMNMLEKIDEFKELHQNDPNEYARRIDEIVSKNDCIGFIADKVKQTYHLSHRAEIFKTLIALYNNGDYQSYISLAVIQLEGIFYDCCTILNQREVKENFGTLIEKADKVFSQNKVIKQAIYPHYAFEVPKLRNEIAHKGFSSEENLYHQANELTLDLYTIVYWCCNLECDKFYSIYEAYRESIEKGIEADKYDEQVLATLFSCYQNFDRQFVDVLADSTQYLCELDFYKSLALSEDAITIKERVNTISEIVKKESFWKKISKELDSITEHKPGKPYDFVDFIIHLRNAVIPVLSKDTPEKLACQEVSKKLKQFN